MMFLISKVQPLPCAFSGHVGVAFVYAWCVREHVAQWLCFLYVADELASKGVLVVRRSK